MKKGKDCSSDLFEEVKIKMVMRLHNLSRPAAVNRLSIQKKLKSYAPARHDDDIDMMSAKEFFADPE